MSKTIFEKSMTGHHGVTLPASGAEEYTLEKHLPEKFIRKNAPQLPEVTELETMRHFVTLSHKCTGIKRQKLKAMGITKW